MRSTKFSAESATIHYTKCVRTNLKFNGHHEADGPNFDAKQTPNGPQQLSIYKPSVIKNLLYDRRLYFMVSEVEHVSALGRPIVFPLSTGVRIYASGSLTPSRYLKSFYRLYCRCLTIKKRLRRNSLGTLASPRPGATSWEVLIGVVTPHHLSIYLARTSSRHLKLCQMSFARRKNYRP